MVDFFIKVRGEQGEQSATFHRFIAEHDIRHLAQEAGVSWIKNENAVDVVSSSPYEELALDVRKKLFNLDFLQTAMEELKDENGRCSLQRLQERSIELQQISRQNQKS